MLKSLSLMLILSIGAFAFEEFGPPDGTIARPGYDNLQYQQKTAPDGLAIGSYYVENSICGTPRVMMLQYQSKYAGTAGAELAYDFIQNYQNLFKSPAGNFKITSTKLILDKFYFINLAQEYNDVAIWGSRLSLKATPGGKVFSAGGEIYSDVSVVTTPAIVPEAAAERARQGIIYNSATDKTENAGTTILPLIFADHIDYRFCYLMKISTLEPRADWRVFVDAHTGEVIWREDTIEYETISGHISGGIQPSTPFDSEQLEPFTNLHIFADGSLVDTTAPDGFYSFEASGADPLTIEILLEGSYLNVNNQIDQDAYYATEVIPGETFDLEWNDDNSTIPERDAFYHGQMVHDFIKTIDPGLTVMDFPMTCRVNVSGACNAYWSSFDRSINFYIEAGNCPNIAQIADVVYHEYGHGITNLQYSAGGHNDPNGAMHEGFSDFIAGLITDQPLIGRGFYGPNTHLRNLDNDNRFPEDWGGEPHNDGLIIGGALWDLKLLLDDERPNYVDTLWQYAKYGYSGDFIGYFWDMLVVDDDDGDIDNGTPHAYEIFYAFGDLHGIGPGVALEIVHTPVIDSEDSTTAFDVTASVFSQFSMDSGTVTLYYSSGGDYDELEMAPAGGDNWHCQIPNQSFGTTVNYYIEAYDDINFHATSPANAPDSVYSFYVGFDLVAPGMQFVAGPANTIDLFGPYGRFAFQSWDVHGVDTLSGQLHYQINAGPESLAPMVVGSQVGEFVLDELEIGQVLQTGDEINFWFTCRDLAINHNDARLPDQGSFTFAMTVSELLDDFEAGIDDWQVFGDGWMAYDQQGYRSNACLKTSGQYYENNENSVIRFNEPFNLTPYDQVWLRFMRRNFFLAGDSCFAVAANSESGPWTRFGGITGNANNWAPYYVELEGFAGSGNEEVYVGLQLITDEADNYFGIFVDDAEIYITQPTGVSPLDQMPTELALGQNYPNPFNLRTIISFTLPNSAPVSLDVFDILGRRVERLIDKAELQAGVHQITWDGTNAAGATVTSGIYFYRLVCGERSAIRQMTLLK